MQQTISKQQLPNCSEVLLLIYIEHLKLKHIYFLLNEAKDIYQEKFAFLHISLLNKSN